MHKGQHKKCHGKTKSYDMFACDMWEECFISNLLIHLFHAIVNDENFIAVHLTAFLDFQTKHSFFRSFFPLSFLFVCFPLGRPRWKLQAKTHRSIKVVFLSYKCCRSFSFFFKFPRVSMHLINPMKLCQIPPTPLGFHWRNPTWTPESIFCTAAWLCTTHK